MSAARTARTDRAVLIGHDWGAVAWYGAVATETTAFRRLVALAAPPAGALAAMLQLPPTQAVVLHLAHTASRASGDVLLEPGFWESLWADWSPGYDPREDVAGQRRHVNAENVANVIAGYRASFNPDFADPNATAEASATLQDLPVPTLYLHGADDGALGVDVFGHPPDHLPAARSRFEIMDGGGHFLHLQRPDLMSARILDWLD